MGKNGKKEDFHLLSSQLSFDISLSLSVSYSNIFSLYSSCWKRLAELAKAWTHMANLAGHKSPSPLLAFFLFSPYCFTIWVDLFNSLSKWSIISLFTISLVCRGMEGTINSFLPASFFSISPFLHFSAVVWQLSYCCMGPITNNCAHHCCGRFNELC